MDTVLELASSLWERTIVTAAAARENAAAVQAPSCASQGSASFIKAVDAALRAVKYNCIISSFILYILDEFVEFDFISGRCRGHVGP